MTLKVHTSKDGSHLVLFPADFDLSDLRGLNFYIKSINGGYLKNDQILIPIADSDVNVIYGKLRQLLTDRFGCELSYEEGAQSLMHKAEDEARKFSDFSQKALLIRDNQVAQDELRHFTEVLKDYNFKRTLRPFQLLAAYHLAFSQNACNFSVPGSGKTTTVLAAYEYLRRISDEHKRVDKLLVVGPLAAFIAWKAEFEECYGREPKVLEIRGGITRKQVEDRLLRSDITEDIIIASYGSLEGRKDIIQNFLKTNRTMVVLDEAHRIKNVEEGIQSFAALSLSPHASSRVVLTGTPAANSYIDLYNLYKFIWPAHNIIGYSTAQLRVMSKNDKDPRVKDLVRRISPFFIRVRKQDLGLPAPTFHEPDTISMSPIQQKIYDAIADSAIRVLEDRAAGTPFRRAAVIRMRQAATNPNLLLKPLDDYYDSLEGEYFKKTELKDSVRIDDGLVKLVREYAVTEVPAKFEATKALAERIIQDGGKLIIWCEFIGTCQNLSDYLDKSGIMNSILFGGTPQEERESIIEEFHAPESQFRVVVANPHAVGESISLHKACHNALYLEQGYNAGTYMQSKDRIHRVGLEVGDETHYYFFHSAGTLDHTVHERVLGKEKRMLDAIESEEIPLLAKNADFLEDTDDDIKAIIRDYYEQRGHIIQ